MPKDSVSRQETGACDSQTPEVVFLSNFPCGKIVIILTFVSVRFIYGPHCLEVTEKTCERNF